MRKPNCLKIVETNKLWEIAIEFLTRVDEALIEYNLKLAYIVYRFSIIENVGFNKIIKLVFLSCFNDIGRLHFNDKNSSKSIETYLFLKYFSPLKDFASIILPDELKDNPNKYSKYSRIFRICKDYTMHLVLENDKDKALEKMDQEIYLKHDYNMLCKLVKSNDLLYELHSMHYKTVVYQIFTNMILGNKEKEELIEMLSSLFEMYSLETLYHSKVTAFISYMLAKKMKVKTENCRKLYIAGLCHDLGKVSIPLSILEKPGRLTPEEYEIMKKHVTYTRQILKHELDFDIIEIAYRHHERIDGSGYPNHVLGNMLTVEQKCLQVADIISALIAKRSYKDSWTIEETINILYEQVNDNKLDKDVVECFNTYQNKILKKTDKLLIEANKTYETINKERIKLIK